MAVLGHAASPAPPRPALVHACVGPFLKVSPASVADCALSTEDDVAVLTTSSLVGYSPRRWPLSHHGGGHQRTPVPLRLGVKSATSVTSVPPRPVMRWAGGSRAHGGNGCTTEQQRRREFSAAPRLCVQSVYLRDLWSSSLPCCPPSQRGLISRFTPSVNRGTLKLMSRPAGQPVRRR